MGFHILTHYYYEMTLIPGSLMETIDLVAQETNQLVSRQGILDAVDDSTELLVETFVATASPVPLVLTVRNLDSQVRTEL